MRYKIAALLVIIGGAVAAAEPDQLYESLSDQQLGRLFLTPSERERLDERRGTSVSDAPASSAAAEGGSGAASARRQPGVGIIVAEGGHPLVWIDGEFRRSESASVEDVNFSAEVSIRIHVKPPVDRMSEEPASVLETADERFPPVIRTAVPIAGVEPDNERDED